MRNKKSCSCRKTCQKRRRQKGGSVLDKVKGLKNNITGKIRKTIDGKLRKNAFSNKKSKLDLHGASLSAIKKIFGKRGMVPKPYHYLGPGNDLNNQVVIGNDGKIKKYKVKPYNILDQIASKHDVCYQNGKKGKSKCDYEMLRNIRGVGSDKIPKGMGGVVNAIIGGKLLLGV